MQYVVYIISTHVICCLLCFIFL